MPTLPLSGRRPASARRQLLAVLTAAFLLFQQALLLAPAASAQTRRAKTLDKTTVAKAPVKAPVSKVPAPTSGVSTKGNAPEALPVSTSIVINEIDYDQVNTDTAEFVELKNVSGAAINLDNYTVQLVNGNAGGATVYDTIDLPNVNLAPGDYYVICANSATVPNCDLDDGPDTDFIQNGSPDAVGLRLSGTLVDAVSYEGNTGSPYTETAGTPNTAAASDSTTVAFIGLSRFADGADTDNNSADLSIRCITPGAANASASTGCTTPPVIPNLTINDVTANETDAGTTTFSFTVSLSSAAGSGGVTFDIATADGTAQDDNPASEDNDYVAKSLTGQTISPGNTTYTFDVTVNGDTAVEPTENFFVNVTNISGAAPTDTQGQGTITNDDSPNLSINDVSQEEGNAGTTAFTFTVSLSSTVHGGVTFDIATADGTTNPANAGTDYVAKSLTSQTIPGGSDTYQFTVDVNGDTTPETDETFFVNVTNVTGASISDGQGLGTIVNDDFNLTPIHTIQGSGASSPIDGQSVTTTGIVTLLKTGSNAGNGAASGFFLQEAEANYDSDPNTSEGIFVFTSSVPAVSVGDSVRVAGTVQEFNGLTEISSVTSVVVLSTGNSLPADIEFTPTDLSPTAAPTQPQLEKYEGMRVCSASGGYVTVAPNDNFFDVYAVLLNVARPMREPGIPSGDPIPPDPTSGTPDPNIPIWDKNPERLKIDTNGRAGAPNVPYTSNVLMSVIGPLDYAFGEYRLVAESDPSASPNMTATAVPEPDSNEFTVASYNIENFHNDATQRQKAADTVRTLLHYPDVIGLVEIDDLVDLQALRDQINDDAATAGDPDPAYEAYLFEGNSSTGGDVDQNVGFLVKTARVSSPTVTQERKDETYQEPGGTTTFLHDRPPLVLDATVDAAGPNPQRVIVVVNHLRSFIGAELVAGDGPRVREKRKKQAESLADLLNDLQTANPGVPVISVGDYNAFQFNSGYDDSVSVIKGNPTPDDQIVVDQSPDLVDPNFTNLIDGLPASERYSFIFEGTPQALDHHLVNGAARSRNTRTAIARVNSDFPEVPAAVYANNAATPERNSDHDPVVSYYRLGAAQAAGSLIISEFRFRGPGEGCECGGDVGPVSSGGEVDGGGPAAPGTPQDNDEFVELYNNTDSDVVVSTLDGSAGWAVVASDGVTRFIIPNDTVIPARGHFLGANIDGYSLVFYGLPDQVLLPSDTSTLVNGYNLDIPDGSGIALFNTADPANYTLDNRLDAAGYATVDPLYREGTGFPAPGAEATSDLEYSFVRRVCVTAGNGCGNGLPKDTSENGDDFVVVNTEAAPTTLGAKLGAPGPEGLTSPLSGNAGMPGALLDPSVSASQPPNRVREFGMVPNGTFGTLSIRRTVTNNTGSPVRYLAFRIIEITTAPTPPEGTADLRAIDSEDIAAEDMEVFVNGNPVDVLGTFVEQPPTQPNGGGLNTSMAVGSINLNTPLEDGDSVNVQFLLGIMQTGRYRFYVNIEMINDGLVQEEGPPSLNLNPSSVNLKKLQQEQQERQRPRRGKQ